MESQDPALKTIEGVDEKMFEVPELQPMPRKASGLYHFGDMMECEHLGRFTKGGWHPVHLDETYGPFSQYRILHKLGHGGTGTVWLCRDDMENRYVALKFYGAEISKKSVADLEIAKLDLTAPGGEYIAAPTDHFYFDGPNGRHLCLVMPVLGPTVSPRIKKSARVHRDISAQAVSALGFLHRNKICHGDFRAANILVNVSSRLNELSETQLLSLIGDPIEVDVHIMPGIEVPEGTPDYLVYPAEIESLGCEYLTDEIRVIDFGEAYQFGSTDRWLGIPDMYLPPELLIEGSLKATGLPCELWALGCLVFEIRVQVPLFYMLNLPEDIMADMVRFFGKPEEELWERWKARGKFFDDQGNWIQSKYGDQFTLEKAMKEEGSWEEEKSAASTVVYMAKMEMLPKAEVKVLADLIRKICRWEPEARLSVDEVLEHEWFKMEL